jgi:hypothetical protein
VSQSSRVAPPYSVVFVLDVDDVNAEIPETTSVITFTESCVAVQCLAEVDGETEFRLGAASKVDPGNRPAFVGTLKTPSRILSIQTAERAIILETPVESERTRISIWINDATRPDIVSVGIH